MNFSTSISEKIMNTPTLLANKGPQLPPPLLKARSQNIKDNTSKHKKIVKGKIIKEEYQYIFLFLEKLSETMKHKAKGINTKSDRILKQKVENELEVNSTMTRKRDNHEILNSCMSTIKTKKKLA